MQTVLFAASCLLFLFPLSCYTATFKQDTRAAAAAPNLVVAHFMVGNTYPYTTDAWASDIALAVSKGIDGFALNVGRDPWQPDRVAQAYAAARQSGTSFKLFLSFDMTSLPCTTAQDITALKQYISTYAQHPNQLLYAGRSYVSTFAGERCTFGQGGNLNSAWTAAVKSGPPVYFVPSFFVDPGSFSTLTVMDGAFNWNAGWPMGNYNVSFGPDNAYISKLGGRSYMAPVSPWFFTHYGPNTYNKNFIYRGDDWLLSERWRLLIQNRASVNVAQILTWNDYGESHYVGPIEGAQPMSQAWVNGFTHTGWLDLISYYIQAYKTGQYPPIAKDKVYLWSRLYPAAANAADSVGRPTNWQWTQDYLWAVVMLTAPASVTLSCGTSTLSVSIPSGVSQLKLPLKMDCEVRATVSRNGVKAIDFTPSGFSFRTRPPSYNFNAFVAASP